MTLGKKKKKWKKKRGHRGSKLFARPAEALCKFLSSDTRKALNQKWAAVTCQTCRKKYPKNRYIMGLQWVCFIVRPLWLWAPWQLVELEFVGFIFFYLFCLVEAGCWLFLDSEGRRKKKKTGDGAIQPAEQCLQNTEHNIKNPVYSLPFGLLHTPTSVFFFSWLWKQVC